MAAYFPRKRTIIKVIVASSIGSALRFDSSIGLTLASPAQTSAARLQSDADAYANQVFEQLIAHVGSTFKGVQQAEAGLNQAMNVLRTAKAQMNAPQGEQQ